MPRAGEPRRSCSWSKNCGGTALPKRSNKIDVLGTLTHQNINDSFCFVQQLTGQPLEAGLWSRCVILSVEFLIPEAKDSVGRRILARFPSAEEPSRFVRFSLSHAPPNKTTRRRTGW